MKKLHILHLSDLHVHGQDDHTLELVNLIPPAIEGEIIGAVRIAIIVSGDIAYSGSDKEYGATLSTFQKLESELAQKSGGKITWVVVPGNHDGAFKNSAKNRLLNIDGVIRGGEEVLDDSVINACVAPQVEYFKFEKLLNNEPHQFKDHLLGIKNIDIEGKTASFWEFNVSWMSRVPEVQGDLVYPISRYEHIAAPPADFRFAVLHHPLNWYTQGTYHPFRQFLTKNFCAIFSGHEHVKNGHFYKALGDETHCMFLQAGALGPHDATETAGFSLLILNLDTGEFSSPAYSYSKSAGAFLKDEAKSQDSKFALSTSRDFEPTQATRDELEELGAPFSHPTKDTLRLSDVYVEPSFSNYSIGEEDANSVDGHRVLKDLLEGGKVIVRGDEHYGKSSFTHQLFYRILNAKAVPVKMTARELSSGTDAKRERAVLDRVAEQFGNHILQSYQALPLSNKVIVVDDFDKLGTNAESYSRALEFITRNFGKCLFTIGETFDASLLGSPDVAEKLGQFETYRMRGFSYSMRTELIQRWYALDLSLDKAQLEAKVHDAQTKIDHAVAKALVPSTAFNTLMILQAMETTQKSQVVDAGVAQHYDMLIRRRLAESGAQPKLFDGIYAYLSHLSWHLKKKDAIALDKPELEFFNDYFRTAIHHADTNALCDMLIRSRILASSDGMYQFRHPSARYFFLAHYIAEYSEEDREAKEYALTACRRLYKKDNANLIVFLASKVASRWIVKEVSAVLSKLLHDINPFNVITDSRTLNGWVTKTAKLAIDTSTDRDERKRRIREREEEAQQFEDSHPERSDIDDVTQLDTFAQINLVFKTSEILGLILKSRFGSLETTLKNELIQQLFDGPLRAIAFFLDAVNDQPEALIEFLSKNWEEKLPNASSEQRTKLAQRFVYFSLGAYAQALIQRQGEIAGSPDLGIYINGLIEATANNEKQEKNEAGTTLTYRLLAVASRLSYPSDIPHGEIERLAKDLEANPFGFTLLQGLVANHLYMFEVNYSSRQRLAAAVQLDLKAQITNEVISQEAKTVTNRKFNQRNPQSLLSRLTQSFLFRNKASMKLVERKTKNQGSV